MRPTDFCHLNDNVYPYLVCSQLTPRLSSRGHPTESWAPCGLPGDRVLHGTRERFGGLLLDTRCHLASPPVAPSFDRMRELGAWALSSHGASKPIEPLAPLSPLPLP